MHVYQVINYYWCVCEVLMFSISVHRLLKAKMDLTINTDIIWISRKRETKDNGAARCVYYLKCVLMEFGLGILRSVIQKEVNDHTIGCYCCCSFIYKITHIGLETRFLWL